MDASRPPRDASRPKEVGLIMSERFATCAILSYERQEFLSQAIETMTRHAEFPMEILVHDDGSEDPSVRAYLRHLVDTGKISALIENPPGHNQGQGIALNRMFHMAKGDPIVKLDQDLIFHQGWLRKAVAVLDRNREVNPQTSLEPTIGALGLFRYPAEPVKYEDMFVRDWGWKEGAWEEHKDFVGSAMVIPRWVWKGYGPFKERSEAFAEDYEFKMLLRGKGLRLALPKEGDLVTNQGFGVGPSTLVVQRENGELTSHEIHKEPPLIDGQGYY